MTLFADPRFLWLALTALVAGSMSTAVARLVAVRTGVLDQPDGGRKIHRDPTPLLGGAAIYAALVMVLGVAWFTPALASLLDTLSPNALPMLLVSGGLFCGLGLFDDIRPMRPAVKLGCQFLAALPYALFGTPVLWIEFCGVDLPVGAALGVAFTAFWLVACANTINLIDGLDGLASTVGLIACVAIACVAELRSLPGAAFIGLVTAGSLSGFLCHNLPPARIFLGDSGSLLIGFLIGALTLESSLKTAAGFAMTVPLILVSLPAFDTLMAIVRRRLTGRGISEGDRGHIHHRLLERGLSRSQTLLVIATLSAAMAALTILSTAFKADRLCLGMCVGLLGILILGRVFGHHEALLFLRRMQKLGQVFAASSGIFGPRQPLGIPVTWSGAIERVRLLGGHRLECYRVDERTGVVRDHHLWVDNPDLTTSWELRVSVRVGGGERLTLLACGDRRFSRAATGLARLFVVLDDCCQLWAPHGGPPPEVVEILPAFPVAGTIGIPARESVRAA